MATTQNNQQELDSALVQRACTLLSPPLSPNVMTGEVDQDSLNTLMALIKDLNSQPATLALSKALVWRVSIGSEPGADLLGSWLLIDATLTSLAEHPTGRFGAIFFDEVFRSVPNLIRCKWEKSKLSTANPSNRVLLQKYEEIERKWLNPDTGLFDGKPRRALELAFKETKTRGLRSLKHFAHLHCDDNPRLMDAIWKLRREEPRPTIARRLYKKVFGGKGEYPETAVSQDRNLIRPLHPRLESWFTALKENKGGCAGCDTFVHNSLNCPCYRTRPIPSLDEAVHILSLRGINNPTNPDSLEVFDAVVEEMLNSRPFGNLISAFDRVRGSTTTSRQQSALYVISTYKLKPSKLRGDTNAGAATGGAAAASGSKVMALSQKIRKYFLDQHRHLELENLEQCVELLRDSFFPVEDSENPEEDLEKLVEKIKSSKMPLFVYFDRVNGVAPAELPRFGGWDARLRRVGGCLSRLCRHCLSLKHCSIECQENTVSYDFVAATRILDRANVEDLKGESIADIKEKIEMNKQRGARYKDEMYHLDAHKLEMALRILVPAEVQRRVEKDPEALSEHILRYSKVCNSYASEADTLRLHARRALARRDNWPTTENQLMMFPEVVPKALTENGRKEPSDRDRDIIDYLKFCKTLPKEFREAVVGLCIDKRFYPPSEDFSEHGQFSPAMIRYCPKLVEDLLRTSGRAHLVNKVPYFRTPGCPEPCIFTGSLAYSSLFNTGNSEETMTFLRELQRKDLDLTTFLDQKSEVAYQLKATLDERRAGTVAAPGAHALQSQVHQYQTLTQAAQGMENVLAAFEELKKACHVKNQEFLNMRGAAGESATQQQQQQLTQGAPSQLSRGSFMIRGDDMVTFTQRPVVVDSTQDENGAAAPDTTATVDEELAAVLDGGDAATADLASSHQMKMVTMTSSSINGAALSGNGYSQEATEIFALVDEYYTNGGAGGDALSTLLEKIGAKRDNSLLSLEEAHSLLSIFQKHQYNEGDELPEEIETVRRKALDVIAAAANGIAAGDEEPPKKRQRVETEA